MATTTDTFASDVTLTAFDRPSTIGTSREDLTIPFGECVFSNADTIPAVGAADVNVVTFNNTLPAGWFWRLAEAQIVANTVGAGDFAEPQSFMLGQITENQVVEKNFVLSNIVNQFSSVDPTPAFAIRGGFHAANPTITNDFSTFYGLDRRFHPGIRCDLVDASQGISQVVITWINDSAAATSAMTFSLYMRFLQYSIEQARHGYVWQP